MNEEVFLPIKGHEDYFVSNKGRILSRKFGKGRILATYECHGYPCIKIEKCKYIIHRLVGETLIPNPHNLPQINHKNEIKNDNRVENLEWCTEEYNTNYGTRNKRAHEGECTEIIKCNLEGQELERYPSMTMAAEQNKISVASVCVCARINGKTGTRRSCGHIWRLGDKDHRHPTKKDYRQYWGK